MKASTKKLIQALNYNKNFLCVFSETGAGMPVASAFLEVPGSSKSVFFAECPYSQEYVRNNYTEDTGGFISERAVSKEYVVRLCKGLFKKIISKYHVSDREVTYAYASTFQINPEGSTHGWIGVCNGDRNTSLYHVSLHNKATRKKIIKTIGEIGINLIDYTINKTSEKRLYNVDAVYEFNHLDESGYISNKKTSLELLSNNTEEQASIFFPDGTIDRIESFFRDKKTVAIYKGSFNPVHKGHIETADLAINKLNIAKSDLLFSISINTVDKGKVEVDSIVKRIEMLNKLGYTVSVFNNGYFKNNLDFIRVKSNTFINFVLGSDTLYRIFKDFQDVPTEKRLGAFKEAYDENCVLLVKNCDWKMTTSEEFNNSFEDILKTVKMLPDTQTRLSSSDIRSGMADDMDKLSDAVPEEIKKEVHEYYKKGKV